MINPILYKAEISQDAMVFNKKIFKRVIQDGILKEWKNRQWNDVREVNKNDNQKYRQVLPDEEVKKYKPEPVSYNHVQTIRMVAGKEKTISRVIHHNKVKEWIGIVWITMDDATQKDYETIPQVI